MILHNKTSCLLTIIQFLTIYALVISSSNSIDAHTDEKFAPDSLQTLLVRILSGSDTIDDSILYFPRSIELRLITNNEKAEIFYSLKNTINEIGFLQYHQPLLFNSSTTLLAYAILPSHIKSTMKELRLVKIENLFDFQIFCDERRCCQSSRRYKLFDGVTDNSETAENGNDYLCLKGSKIEFWVDFGIKRQVNEVKFHLYVAETKNLILPSILVEGSENGYEFYPLGQKRFSVTFNKSFWVKVELQPAKVRYIRIGFYNSSQSIENDCILIDEINFDSKEEEF